MSEERKDLSSEIDAMTEMISGDEVVEVDDHEVEEGKVEDVETEEEVVATEVPSEEDNDELDETPTTEASKEEEEEEEIDPKYQALMDKIAELEAEIKKPKEEKEELTPTTDAPIEVQDFVGELDVEEFGINKEHLNHVFNKVYSTALEQARKEARKERENILRDIPQIVKTNMEVTTSLKEASDNFYKDNPDLTGFKKVVATVFTETVNEHPGKKLTDILDMVGPEVRKRLNLKKQVNKDKDVRVPKLPKKTGGKVSRPSDNRMDAFANELSEMDNALDNY